MFKRISQALFAVFCLLMSFLPASAATLIDSTAVTTAQTDIITDIGVVAAAVITILLAFLGYRFAKKALS